MGQYVPRLVSPVTGGEEAAPTVTAYIFETDAGNMTRWRRWWRFANLEQVFDFVARHLRHDRPHVDAGALDALRPARPRANDVAFLQHRGRRRCRVSSGRGSACSSGRSAPSRCSRPSMGIIDYTSRLAADLLRPPTCAAAPSPRADLLPAGVGHGRRSAWRSCWPALAAVVLLVISA